MSEPRLEDLPVPDEISHDVIVYEIEIQKKRRGRWERLPFTGSQSQTYDIISRTLNRERERTAAIQPEWRFRLIGYRYRRVYGERVVLDD